MGRTLRLGLAGVVLALGGCKDLGVRGAANVPLGSARIHPAAFWSYQAVKPQQRQAYQGLTGDVFTLGTQRFIVQFPDFAGPPSALAPVGAQAGATVYAPRWAQAPYDRLYVSPGPERMQVATEIWH